jgi:hypothetical protein
MKNQAQKSITLKKSERRRYPRCEKKTRVETGRVTYPLNDSDFARGSIRNISLGGVLLEIPEEFETGTLIQLRITLPGWHKYHPGFLKVLEDSIGTPFSAIGEVLRCKKENGRYTTAARFINIDPDDFISLQNYLEKAMPA